MTGAITKEQLKEHKRLEDPDTLPPQDIGAGSDQIVVADAFPSSIGFADGNVRFKFKVLGQREPGQAWIVMVYGPSKTGKTYFSGTAGPRSLFINIGDGIETLLAPAFTSKYPDAKEMITVDIREMNPNGAAEAFDMVTEVIDHALKHFPDKFDNIILDEATALRKYALNKAMELNTGARTQGKTRENRILDYVKADIGDFGEEMNMIEWFLGQYIPTFKEKGKNFLMIAHERQIYQKPAKIGDEPTLKRIIPGFTGKTFPDKVPASFDDVWHSEVILNAAGNAAYRLRTAGNEQDLAGARHGGIFETVEVNPNFQQMLARIKAAQPKPTTQPRR